MPVPKHPRIRPRHIRVGQIAKRESQRLDHHVVDRKLVARRLTPFGHPFGRGGVQLGAKDQQRIKRTIERQVKMWNGALRFDQSARDRPPHRVVRHDFVESGSKSLRT